MMTATRIGGDACGRWYSDREWHDHPDLAPTLGHCILVVGEITSLLTVLEETGTPGLEDHVLTHTFTLRVPRPIGTGDPVELRIVEPTCTFYEDMPRWIDAVRPGRRLEGRLSLLQAASPLDERGQLRADKMERLHDVRVFIPDEEA